MKLFKKSKQKKTKPNKGQEFLMRLTKAVFFNEGKEEFQYKFGEILRRADEMNYKGKGVKTLNDSTKKSIEAKGLVPVTETPEYKKTVVTLADELMKFSNDSEEVTYPISVKPVASSFKTESKPKLVETKFQKFKLKMKNAWLLTKEFGRIIKNWAIVEYKTVRKLTYALNKKKEEVKIRRAFESNMINFVNAHGYDKGMQKYDKLVRGIQYSINFDKRLEKLGR